MSYIVEQRETNFLARNGFRWLWSIPHLHPHFELIYLLEGNGTATVDKTTVPLGEGDVFFAFPNQIHFFDVEPARGYIFIVSPDLFPDLKELLLNRVAHSPVIRKELLPGDVERQVDMIFRQANGQDRLQQLEANGRMQALLAQLLGRMELEEAKGSSDSVKQLLLYCSQHYRQPLTLESLAGELHLSVDYISHIFSDRLGVHFPEFINRLRVEQACRQLHRGGSMTEAAYSCGFGSVRSFNRNFKQIMGESPTSYMRSRA